MGVIGGKAVKNWSTSNSSTKAHPRTMKPLHFISGPNFRAPHREPAGISKLAKRPSLNWHGALERAQQSDAKTEIVHA